MSIYAQVPEPDSSSVVEPPVNTSSLEEGGPSGNESVGESQTSSQIIDGFVDAGRDQTVIEGDYVTLRVNSTYRTNNPNGTLEWEQVDTSGIIPILSNPQGETVSFRAPSVGENTTLTFRSSVTDNSGLDRLTDTVNVFIVNAGSAPVFWSDSPGTRVGLALATSFVSVLLVFVVANRIITRKKSFVKRTTGDVKFADIIRADDGYPALSIFQFLLWTFIILFVFLTIYLIRIFGGVFDPPQASLPINILALMGISVAVPATSYVISAYRYKSAEQKEKSRMEKKPAFSTMLTEDNRPTLSRFQMFAWTWISIAIYLAVFFLDVSIISRPVEQLRLPDIDPTLVILMGLSQAAYLGGKIASKITLEVTKVNPTEPKLGQIMSIFGTFSDKTIGGIVWLNGRALQSTSKNEVLSWSADRIDIRVPSDLEPGQYKIEIAAGGALVEVGEKVIIKEQSQNVGGPEPAGKVAEPDVAAGKVAEPDVAAGKVAEPDVAAGKVAEPDVR
jgi:hypothetical protein